MNGRGGKPLCDDEPGSGQVADRFAATTIARGQWNCPAGTRGAISLISVAVTKRREVSS